MLAKKYGLETTSEVHKLNLASTELFRELNRVLVKEKLTSALYKAGLTFSVIVSENDISGCYGGLLFLLAFSLSRTSNFRTQSWNRRFVDIQRQLLTANSLLNSVSETSAREVSTLIDAKIKDG
jgi:hypothetical protein